MKVKMNVSKASNPMIAFAVFPSIRNTSSRSLNKLHPWDEIMQ